MKTNNAIEIISNVVECEIETAEDANDPIYAEDLKIALEKVRQVINKHLDKGNTNDRNYTFGESNFSK